jgi:hypothetical protein
MLSALSSKSKVIDISVSSRYSYYIIKFIVYLKTHDHFENFLEKYVNSVRIYSFLLFQIYDLILSTIQY